MMMRLALAAVLALSVSALIAATPPALFPDRTIEVQGAPRDVRFSPDGRFVAVGTDKGVVGVWDADAGASVRSASLCACPLARLAFNAQANLVAAGGQDGKVYLLDLRTGASKVAATHQRGVTSVAFSREGDRGASADSRGEILLWDGAGREMGRLTEDGHKGEVLYLGFDPAGGLVSVGKDLKVITWDAGRQRAARRGTLQSETFGRTVVPAYADMDSEGRRIGIAAQTVAAPRGGVLAGQGGLARPEDLARTNAILPYAIATGVLEDAVPTARAAVERVALAPAGCFAFGTSFDRNRARLAIWNVVDKGDPLLQVDLPAHATALALDAAGRRLAVGLEDGKVQISRVSGTTREDCEALTNRRPQAAGGPQITAGAEARPLIPAGTDLRLAVLRFDAGGVAPFLADAVSDMVLSELSNTPRVVVIERAAIDAILKEMELQRSGLTTADAVRIGKGLNAKKVIFGSVRRFGETTFVILARMVDVETQKVEGTREVTCAGCKEEDLPRAIAVLRKLIVS